MKTAVLEHCFLEYNFIQIGSEKGYYTRTSYF